MSESVDFESRFRLALSSIERAKPAVAFEGEKLAKVTRINLFQQPEAHPVALDLALLRKYGPEWMYWEPETLVWRIPQDFKTSGVSDLNLDKIQACKALHFNDNYWRQWEVFNWCTSPFCNMYPNFEVMQVPSTAQMMVSVSIAETIRTDVDWSEEVRGFMIAACRYDGIFYPPPPLEFLSVGTQHGAVNEDEIRKRWPTLVSSGKEPTGDTVEDEQLRRMLEAHTFLETSRNRLQEQLPLVTDD